MFPHNRFHLSHQTLYRILILCLPFLGLGVPPLKAEVAFSPFSSFPSIDSLQESLPCGVDTLFEGKEEIYTSVDAQLIQELTAQAEAYKALSPRHKALLTADQSYYVGKWEDLSVDVEEIDSIKLYETFWFVKKPFESPTYKDKTCRTMWSYGLRIQVHSSKFPQPEVDLINNKEISKGKPVKVIITDQVQKTDLQVLADQLHPLGYKLKVNALERNSQGDITHIDMRIFSKDERLWMPIRWEVDSLYPYPFRTQVLKINHPVHPKSRRISNNRYVISENLIHKIFLEAKEIDIPMLIAGVPSNYSPKEWILDRYLENQQVQEAIRKKWIADNNFRLAHSAPIYVYQHISANSLNSVKMDIEALSIENISYVDSSGERFESFPQISIPYDELEIRVVEYCEYKFDPNTYEGIGRENERVEVYFLKKGE